jgi:hypothetical protein
VPDDDDDKKDDIDDIEKYFESTRGIRPPGRYGNNDDDDNEMEMEGEDEESEEMDIFSKDKGIKNKGRYNGCFDEDEWGFDEMQDDYQNEEEEVDLGKEDKKDQLKNFEELLNGASKQDDKEEEDIINMIEPMKYKEECEDDDEIPLSFSPQQRKRKHLSKTMLWKKSQLIEDDLQLEELIIEEAKVEEIISVEEESVKNESKIGKISVEHLDNIFWKAPELHVIDNLLNNFL